MYRLMTDDYHRDHEATEILFLGVPGVLGGQAAVLIQKRPVVWSGLRDDVSRLNCPLR
jgi:hypothetical protein